MKTKKTQVTIIGGGFGGIKTALGLLGNPSVHVTLITDREFFQYYPTLYSSATGYSHKESWVSLGEIFAGKENISIYIDSIEKIDNTRKCVTGTSGVHYDYDMLVIGVGVVTNYFGIPGLETYAYGIKSAEEIHRLKQRIFIDIAEKGQLDKNYIIVGAGPTGVELSAAIGTYIRNICKKYGVSHKKLSVQLIEAAPRVLPRSSELTSRRVEARLRRLGVTVRTGMKVEKENANELIVSGAPVASHTVIWTSGVTNHPLFARHPKLFTLAKNGRVEVNQYLEAAKNIYVIGDNAATPFTGLAQTAIHDARYVTKDIVSRISGKNRKIYHAVMPVSAVPVGKNWAVVEWKWIRFYGWLGGLIRRFADLVGYSELLPLGTSLGAWRAGTVKEDSYYAPTLKHKHHK
jgi:NADH dehydrogenase